MADLTSAFREGQRRMAEGITTTIGNQTSIGNPVGTTGEYDPKTSEAYETAFSADKISHIGLKAGQHRGHYGTTVFQPKRCDPEVEAILGKHEYKQKISKDSPDAIRLKQVELENVIATQQAQINMLTQLMAAGKTPEPAVKQVPKPIEVATPEEIPAEKDYRAVAKTAGVKTFGRKKDEVIAELKDKGLM